MDNFELPTNVKQIGSIEKGLRVYVEDYVFTFIQQYTQAGGANERLATLVGRFLTIDEYPVLFVSGAIEGRFCVSDRGHLEFSDKSKEYTLDIMDKYFPALEVVGWVQSQPGYGTYLSSKYYNYHMQNFKKDFQVLFVTDPIQKINTFYMYNENNELAESRGYFVYYDKNKAMHEYMMDCKAQNSDIGGKSAAHMKADSDDGYPNKTEETPEEILHSSYKPSYSIRRTPPKKATASPSAKYSSRRAFTGTDQRRLVNMLAGLCAVMFLICFVMGAGLIRSDDRINVLEQNLSALNTAYRDLTVAMEPALSAFAQGGAQNRTGVVLTEDGNKLLEAENAQAAVSKVAQPPGPAVAADNTAQAQAVTVSANNLQEDSVPESYTVLQGDSLIGISRKIYGNSDMVEKIMEANQLTDPDKIFFGQILILPKP